MIKKEILLTGIKPTGVPHVGNYLGVIKPGLELAKDYRSFFFIADYHAANQIKNGKALRNSIYNVTASWLACGLNPDASVFYQQSQISAIPELMIMLANVTPKGLMNRSHAYKAIIDDNQANLRDLDEGVNMGLFNYPILMSADILMFHAHKVPVGKDQIQHLEIACDIAEAFNRTYGDNYLTLPKPLIDSSVETILGIDGRKMSKSYNNIIPIFAEDKKIRKAIMSIVTNSQTIEESKNPDTCPIFTLFRHFSTTEEQEELAKRYRAGGMGWGEAKQALYEKFIAAIKPMQETYQNYINDPSALDRILNQGSERAQEIAEENLKELKKVVGVSL